MPKTSQTTQTSWLDQPFLSNFRLNWETGIVALLLIAAILTRFYGLGDRVMSHDETTHVYFSWQLFKGNGYAHDPLSHGPLQFHLVALSYFLFGDNDFTARAPQALFSVATVLFVWWGFRRYLGRIGAIAAAFFFLISPYMLYYGRYARNESWVALFGLAMLWGVLRYLDTGKHKYLYVTTAAIALHFTAKETSFIYLAQILLFLGFLFLYRIGKIKWAKPQRSQYFYMLLLVAGSLLIFALSAQASSHQTAAATDVPSTEVQEPVVQDETEAAPAASIGLVPAILGGLAVVCVGASLYFLVTGFGWERLRKERSFGVMLLIFTLALPHLAAFPIEWLRPDLNYTALKGIILNWVNGVQLAPAEVNAIILTLACVVFLLLISAALGLLWSPRVWAISFGIFFAIFIPLFTTMFTNGAGIFTGLVGSLGYWLEQQGVERGSQPWYFYALVQVPIYEFLALFGTLVAAFIGFRYWRHLIPVFLLIIIWPFFTFGLFVFIGIWSIPFAAIVGIFLGRLILSRWPKSKPLPDSVETNLQPEDSRHLALVLISFWAITSLVAYTVAGEKMPWLTVHIALPLLLLAGWAAGWIIKRVDWARLLTLRSLFAVFAAIVFIVALVSALGSLLGTHPPFAGSTQLQLQDTYRFVFYALLALVSAYEMLAIPDQAQWKPGQFSKVFVLLIFGGLVFFGARTAFRANYINYDYATEYLVYAHMAPGPKEIMTQVEELSKRLTDSNDIQIAYDNETTYPFWWYLRNYPNQRYYADQPTRDLRDFLVILVGDANYGKIEPIVGNSYYMYEYNRIWWPNQDYFEYSHDSIGASFAAETGLPASDMPVLEYLSRVGNRLWSYFGNPQYREAIWQIWLNRDFRPYLEAKGQDPSLAKWVPSRTMRMYVRKDIAAMIWDYGIPPAAESVSEDPYVGKGIELGADIIIGSTGTEPGQFNSPRGVAVAPDGSVYVADSLNHRIQHFGVDGAFISEWGTPSDPNSTELRGGTFNEPWGVAVSPDGAFVYVADTWNHRIQKFTSSGIFLKTWGNFGQDDQPYSMWGPRDILVDNDGNVLVMDTGNKHIKVFDADGNFISQFGTGGLELGQFDEPVGMALDRQLGRLYVADTWNQRVQVLDYSDGIFSVLQSWDIAGWFGQSLVNKPYLCVGNLGQVFVTDPESGRILVFTSDGTFVKFFGGYEQTAVEIGIAQAVAANANGVWVTDSQNNKLLHFNIE
jgi:hypothetical protein